MTWLQVTADTQRESLADPVVQTGLPSVSAVYQLLPGLCLFQSQHDKPGTERVHLHHHLLKSYQMSASMLLSLHYTTELEEC